MTRMIVSAAAILALGLGVAQAADPSTGGSPMQDNRAAPAPMNGGASTSPGTNPGTNSGADSKTGMRDGQSMGAGPSGIAMRSGPTVADLKDKDVYAMSGEQVGEVTDVLVGADGRPEALVVSHGGFLGVGQDEGVVAINRVRTGPDGVVLRMTREQVADLPPYDGTAAE